VHPALGLLRPGSPDPARSCISAAVGPLGQAGSSRGARGSSFSELLASSFFSCGFASPLSALLRVAWLLLASDFLHVVPAGSSHRRGVVATPSVACCWSGLTLQCSLRRSSGCLVARSWRRLFLASSLPPGPVWVHARRWRLAALPPVWRLRFCFPSHAIRFLLHAILNCRLCWWFVVVALSAHVIHCVCFPLHAIHFLLHAALTHRLGYRVGLLRLACFWLARRSA
jgi:hypothetical protein